MPTRLAKDYFMLVRCRPFTEFSQLSIKSLASWQLSKSSDTARFKIAATAVSTWWMGTLQYNHKGFQGCNDNYKGKS